MRVARAAPLGMGLLMAAALGAALAATAVGQETTGRIAGRVVNGTAGATAVEGTEVSLRVFREGELIDNRTVVPNSQGRFVFQSVPVPGQGEPLYILTATYLEVSYSVELTGESDLSDILIVVHESTGSLDSLSVKSSSLFILRADVGARTLSVFEILTMTNEGDRVFVPDLVKGNPMSLLRFPLPAGAIGLEVDSELTGGQVLQVDKGFALVVAVPPGEHGIAFTYLVPYSGRVLDLSRRFGMGAETFRLLISKEAASVGTSDLEDLGVTAIGATVYQIFGATDIEREDRVMVALTNLPQPSLWQRIGRWLSLGPAGTTVSVVLSLALTIPLLLVLIGRLPTRGVETTEGISSMALDRTALTRAIAALDDRAQRGEVPEGKYGRERKALKARALGLTQREERA